MVSVKGCHFMTNIISLFNSGGESESTSATVYIIAIVVLLVIIFLLIIVIVIFVARHFKRRGRYIVFSSHNSEC